MRSSLFPSILTRKQYLIRLLFLVGVVLVALICFVGAPTGRAAQAVGIVYVAIVIIAVFTTSSGWSFRV